MGKGYKPLVPPGKAPSKSSRPVTSLKLARKLTSKFHSLLAEQNSIETNSSLSSDNKKIKLKEIEQEIHNMGGREAYQEASALSTKNFRSSRYIFKTLVNYGQQPRKGEYPLRVLEIGAVNPQLVVSPWLKVRAIDLLSRHPRVEQKDFFLVPIGSGPPGDILLQSSSSSSSSSSNGTVSLTRDSIIAPSVSRLHDIQWPVWSKERNQTNEPSKKLLSSHIPTHKLTNISTTAHSSSISISSSKSVSGTKRPRTDSSSINDEDSNDNDDDHDNDSDDGNISSNNAASSSKFQITGTFQLQTHLQNVEIYRHAPSHRYSTPIIGGYDVVVNAMVVNCVMDPVQRSEMLIRCRDHLVAGGLFYLALPSRCIDMSNYLTRKMFEQLLVILGFRIIHEKRTPKISFYFMRREDIVPTFPSSTATRITSHSAPSKAFYQKQNITGYGNDWKPIIVAENTQEYNFLTRFTNPPRMLSKNELPVTGFSRTEFGLSIPKEWILKNYDE